MSNSENNKRLAKNTILLYVRMVLMMLVSLYTSRVVLQVLGITDFGIYNVVGGVITMLGCINGSLSGSTSRFITFELGKGNIESVTRVFRCASTIHYVLAILVLILAETVGLWFVMNKMVIPGERQFAALCVYQFSVVTYTVSILNVPFNALIIAHEKMDVFAAISIVEAISKLLLVSILGLINADRLILYALLMLVVQLSIQLIYICFCKKNFKESSVKWLWDKHISHNILTYTFWTFNGSIAVLGYTQGLNILLNLFFGPVVNAARGIAIQVQTAVNQFFMNFQVAVRPQVTKAYAQGNLSYMNTLVFASSRYSFYLIILVLFPLFINTEYVLYLWLGFVPKYSVAFVQLMLIVCIDTALAGPTLMAIHATGDIKRFQIIEGSILLTILPIAYLLLKYVHIQPETVLVVYIVIEYITQFVRVLIVFPRVKMSLMLYLKSVCFPIIMVFIPILLLGYTLYYNFEVASFCDFLVSCMICFTSSVFFIFTLGLNKQEKVFVFNKLKSFFLKK